MINPFPGSAAMALINILGWQYRQVNDHDVELESCPFCGVHGYNKFYMYCAGIDDAREERDKDGVHQCHKCKVTGNLTTLRVSLGLDMEDVESKKEQAGGNRSHEDLPDVEACHIALMGNLDALEYLTEERGWSREVIERQQLGLMKVRFQDIGYQNALVIPYLVNGQVVWAKYRSLPTMPIETNQVKKAFKSASGHPAALYNAGALRPGLEELLLLEGEADCISAINVGIENSCGVPGANIKKAEWIKKIDDCDPKKVYVCYDTDTPGQDAAREIASRIGFARCYHLVIPPFTFIGPDGEEHVGKDLTEWLAKGGGTAERLRFFMGEARRFDISGVANAKSSIDEFMAQLEGHGAVPKYATAWESLNRYVGFNEGDVIDILAPEKVGKTTFVLNFMEHMVSTYKEDGIIICLEMSRAALARKYVAMKAHIRDTIPETPDEAIALAELYKQGIVSVQQELATREGDLLFSYPKYKTCEDIYTLINDCVRRYGVKWVALDNLHRLADTTVGGKNRTQHLSEVSKFTSQIAKDNNIQLVRILQPHRIQTGGVITTENVDGSSQIAKDCDHMLTLWRERLAEPEPGEDTAGTFAPEMRVTVGLSRYSMGGSVELYYDGACSLVRDLTPYEKGFAGQRRAEKEYKNDQSLSGALKRKVSAYKRTSGIAATFGL